MDGFLTANLERKIRTTYVRAAPICQEESEYMLGRIHQGFKTHLSFVETLHLSENTIYFENAAAFKDYVESWPSARSLLRKIIVDSAIPKDDDSFHTFRLVARVLRQCRKLEEVTIGVDEVGLVLNWSRERNGQQEVLMRPQDIDMQLNLLVLPAVRELRQVRIRKVAFTDLHGEISWKFNENWPEKWRVPRGAIPNGVLETIVLPEMTPRRKRKRTEEDPLPSDNVEDLSPKRPKTEQRPPTNDTRTFRRFFEFPPEIRNRVYEEHLTQAGAINPSTRPPSSQRAYGRRNGTPAPLPIPSALALLQVCKLVLWEAESIYYLHNDFIFYYPNQFLAFCAAISPARKLALQSIEIWCYQGSMPHLTVWDLVMRQLKDLHNLKELRIVLCPDNDMTLTDYKHLETKHLADLRALRRRGVKIELKCRTADRVLWAKAHHVWTGSGRPPPRSQNSLTKQVRAVRCLAECKRIERRIERGHTVTPPPSLTSSNEENSDGEEEKFDDDEDDEDDEDGDEKDKDEEKSDYGDSDEDKDHEDSVKQKEAGSLASFLKDELTRRHLQKQSVPH